METTAKRHPIRGAVSGLLLGLGTAFLLISFSVIALGTFTPLVVVVLGMALGLLVALAWPAPAGQAPPAPPAEPGPVAGFPPPPGSPAA